jgi:hypothetical protein
MGTKVVKSSLLSYFHYVANDSARPLDTEEEYEIPPDAIHYVRSNSFAGDGSKTPANHLQMIYERCSLFKLFGISQEEAMKKLFFMSLIGDARKWNDSLLHTDRDN